jgi:hypothetical protein
MALGNSRQFEALANWFTIDNDEGEHHAES